MISIILPAYNESKVIANVINDVQLELTNRKVDYEIIVVNDNSNDETQNVAEKAGAKVISHPYNIGNGAAIKTGIRNSKGDTLVLMDSDGQHKARDITKLLEFIDKYDMVVGARISNKSGAFHRNIANSIFNIFASYITHYKVRDLTSGFRVVKKDVLNRFLYLLPNTFSYPSTITLALIRSGYSIKYVPIEVEKRIGKSKIKIISDGIRFLVIILKIGTLFSPLRIFIPISTTFFAVGVWHLYYKVFYLDGKYTDFTIFMFIVSIIIFLLGLISEQITQIKYEKSN